MSAFKRIASAMRKGWIAGDIEWREEFVNKDIHPDKFLALPNNQGKEMLAQYLALPSQGKVQFLNMVQRSNLFKFAKIDD